MINGLSWYTDRSVSGFDTINGFTFNGRHCSDFGVIYIPDDSSRWQDGEYFEIFSDEVPGKPGAYYWGNKTQPKQFQLQCFFEAIERHTYTKLLGWLGKDNFGDLEFDSKPGMKYRARVTNRITPRVYAANPECYNVDEKNLYSGTFTVNLTAYNPFARMDFLSVDDRDDFDLNQGFLLFETGMLHTDIMPPTNYNGVAIGQSKSILLYNPGSATCPVTINIGGTIRSGQRFTIYNRTTDQTCYVQELPTTGYLKVDSEKGRVTSVLNGVETIRYISHDGEYLNLVGSAPVDRGLTIRIPAGLREGKCLNGLRKDMEGKYFYVNSTLGWKKIVSVTDPITFTIDFTPTQEYNFSSDVVTMNEIVLTGYSGLTFPTFNFDYVPYFY